jgi:hypothetical protein
MHRYDFDPYVYIEGFPLAGVQSIGWLAAGERIRTGTLPAELLQKLADVAAHHVNPSRGFHPCLFCGRRQLTASTSTGKRVWLGSAEVWLPSPSTMFAAPNLIVHYIGAHGYLPPDAFIAALESVDVDAWRPARELATQMLEIQYPSEAAPDSDSDLDE